MSLAAQTPTPAWASIDKITLEVMQISAVLNDLVAVENCEICPVSPHIAERILAGHTDWLGQVPAPYPALMSRSDLLLYRKLALMVPHGGTIVEVGSKWGGSAKALLDVIDPSVTLHCIDKSFSNPRLGSRNPLRPLEVKEEWRTHKWGIDPVLDTMTNLEWSTAFLNEHLNVRLHGCDNPSGMQWWNTQIDMVFEDACHSNPELHNSLEFWMQWVRSGGIIAGHDYQPNYPDVINEAQSLADRLGTELLIERHGELAKSSVWWLVNP